MQNCILQQVGVSKPKFAYNSDLLVKSGIYSIFSIPASWPFVLLYIPEVKRVKQKSEQGPLHKRYVFYVPLVYFHADVRTTFLAPRSKQVSNSKFIFVRVQQNLNKKLLSTNQQTIKNNTTNLPSIVFFVCLSLSLLSVNQSANQRTCSEAWYTLNTLSVGGVLCS